MTPHPSSVIEDYYKLPIEEYGPGFIQKPIRPFLLETRDLLPDCSCYNNILLFSMEHPKNKIAWRVDKGMNGKKYKLIKLYEEYDGEELKSGENVIDMTWYADSYRKKDNVVGYGKSVIYNIIDTGISETAINGYIEQYIDHKHKKAYESCLDENQEVLTNENGEPLIFN